MSDSDRGIPPLRPTQAGVCRRRGLTDQKIKIGIRQDGHLLFGEWAAADVTWEYQHTH